MSKLNNTLNNTLLGTTPLPPASQPAVPPISAGLKVPETAANLTDKNLPKEITKLQNAQQSPNTLIDFQKVMQLTSTQAYKERQTGELKLESTAFDPTKVSGGTFAAIIGNLEQNRGADTGKIYATTLNAYASAQEQITNRLQFLQQLKQSRDNFNAELRLKKQDRNLSLRELNQKQAQWEKEFALAKAKADNGINANETFPNLGKYKAEYNSMNPTTNPVPSNRYNLPK